MTLRLLGGVINLNGYTLTAVGNLSHSGGTFNLNGGTLNVNGSLTTSGTLNLQGQDICVGNDLTQTGGSVNIDKGSLNVNGNLKQTSGTMNIGGGTLKVKGNYSLTDANDSSSNAYLKMVNENDKVVVAGNFTTKSSNRHDGFLTAGVLEIGGNFYQSGTYESFKCSGTHKVVFIGSGKQSASFSSSSSRFNILQLTKPKDNYTFKPDNCWNELVILSKKEYTDSANGINVTTYLDGELIANKITDNSNIANINFILSKEKVESIYDISFKKDETEIHPYLETTIKIPTSYKNVKVYYFESDGTLIDTNAVFENGYMIFSTENLGRFVMAVDNNNLMVGDADGDGNISLADTIVILKVRVGKSGFSPNYYTQDINGNGQITVIDAILLLGYLVQ